MEQFTLAIAELMGAWFIGYLAGCLYIHTRKMLDLI